MNNICHHEVVGTHKSLTYTHSSTIEYVLRSNNRRTQAVGVTIAVAAGIYGLAKLGSKDLDIISNR